MTDDTPRRRASVANGKLGGRPRTMVRRIDGADAVVIREGDEFALIDANGPTLAQAHIRNGMLVLVRADGASLSLIRSE